MMELGRREEDNQGSGLGYEYEEEMDGKWAKASSKPATSPTLLCLVTSKMGGKANGLARAKREEGKNWMEWLLAGWVVGWTGMDGCGLGDGGGFRVFFACSGSQRGVEIALI